MESRGIRHVKDLGLWFLIELRCGPPALQIVLERGKSPSVGSARC